MKVFLTGSDGFIGRATAAHCAAQGVEVIGADLTSGFDVRSKDIAERIPDGVDAVIHLAGLSNDPMCKNNGYACFDNNVLGTLNLMDAAAKRNAKQFIFASTEWVYDNCTKEDAKTEESLIDIRNLSSEYALSKLVSESNLRQKYGNGFCPVTVLRFGIVCGTTGPKKSAVESLFLAVRDKGEVEVGSLESGRCFIHVSDIAAGVHGAIGLPGFEIINLAGDRVVTLREIIDISKRVTGKAPQVRETNPGAISVRNISNAKAKRLLRFEPAWTVETWLAALAQS